MITNRRIWIVGRTLGHGFTLGGADVPDFNQSAAAFDAAMRDPALLEEAAKIKLDIRPLPGAEVQALIAKVFATPADVAEKAKRAMTQR